jgi:hypothetical protein
MLQTAVRRGVRQTTGCVFFSEEVNGLLDRWMETIIPADAHSPGAHAAQVSLFADWMVSTGSDEEKRRWRNGVRLLREANAGVSVEEAVAMAAAHEGNPKTELDHFFEQLKEMTINGYYTSETGIHRELKYQGNTYLVSFPGCIPGAGTNR